MLSEAAAVAILQRWGAQERGAGLGYPKASAYCRSYAAGWRSTLPDHWDDDRLEQTLVGLRRRSPLSYARIRASFVNLHYVANIDDDIGAFCDEWDSI